METMRELLRANLRRSLKAMPELERLAVAWPVVCGLAMSKHGEVAGYQDGIVQVQVLDENWMSQLMSMQGQIGGELGRVAGVPVTGVHFEMKKRQRG